MEIEEAVKIGFLFTPPQSFLRKTWLKKYCAVYDSSNHGIQRIELFESQETFVKQYPSKIIPLTDCIKVCPAPQKQQPNVFEVRMKDNVYQFSADTFQDMSDWLTSLQKVAFGKNLFKSSMSASSNTKDEKQEENLLYSSMDEPEIFSVKTVPTEATLRNKLIGNFKLIVTPVNLSIADENSQGRIGKIIFTWPYRHIRRYGCSNENFSFEAGRKCMSGEGLFSFSTNNGMLIFQSVDSHVLALKSSKNEPDISSCPSVNDAKKIFASKDSLKKRDHSLALKYDSAYSSTCINDNDTAFSVNKSSTLKFDAPVTKPPRKSKSSKLTYDFISPNVSQVKDTVIENYKYSPSVYEELYKDDCLNLCQSSLKPSIPCVTDYYEQLILDKTEENVLCNNIEKLHICNLSKQHESSTLIVNDYENCDPFFCVPKTEQIYGTISNDQKTVPIKDSSGTYGSILPKKNSNPMYSNIPFYHKSYDNINNSDDIKQNLDHFIKNDAEYAQVLKKN